MRKKRLEPISVRCVSIKFQELSLKKAHAKYTSALFCFWFHKNYLFSFIWLLQRFPDFFNMTSFLLVCIKHQLLSLKGVYYLSLLFETEFFKSKPHAPRKHLIFSNFQTTHSSLPGLKSGLFYQKQKFLIIFYYFLFKCILTQVHANDEGSDMSGYLWVAKNKKWKRLWFVVKGKVLYTYKASEVKTFYYLVHFNILHKSVICNFKLVSV